MKLHAVCQPTDPSPPLVDRLPLGSRGSFPEKSGWWEEELSQIVCPKWGGLARNAAQITLLLRPGEPKIIHATLFPVIPNSAVLPQSTQRTQRNSPYSKC